MKIKKGKNAKKLDIIVIRSCSGNKITMARPCYHCLQMMKSVNIKYCYYSTYEGTIIREKISKMISVQLSFNQLKLTYKCNENNKQNISKFLHYELLMKKTIPQTIDNISLQNFIQYNFNILFPKNYYYSTHKNKIIFYNNMNIIITSSVII